MALIRPGPIQGGSVHPFIRRKNGKEEITYPHPLMRNALEKTLGVPLFQEQLMQLAIDVAGFDASEADQLRRAMGSKRSMEKMEKIKHRLYDGMAERGITGELADDLFLKLSAFANYGFPESHAMSFAYLVYASAWLKRYHPAAFCAALLNAQPMGFYSPQSLVDDARRHGVEVRRPDINLSDAAAVLESTAQTRWGSLAGRAAARVGAGRAGRAAGAGQCADARRRTWPRRSRRNGGRMARTGTCLIWPGAPAARPRTWRRSPPPTPSRVSAFPAGRRSWAAGAAAQDKPDRLPGTVAGTEAPTLPGMGEVDKLVADVWATGLSPDAHPAQFIRDRARRGRRAADRAAGPGRGGHPDPGRRDRHPSAAAGDRGRGDVREPGGRDRDAQRDLFAGAVAEVPAGGPQQRGADRAGPAGEGRGGAQPGGRPAGSGHPADQPGVPRLPVTCQDYPDSHL